MKQNKYTNKNYTPKELKLPIEIEKISDLITEINKKDLSLSGVKIEVRSEYAIKYLEEVLEKYKNLLSIDTSKFVHGRGTKKISYPKRYEKYRIYQLKILMKKIW